MNRFSTHLCTVLGVLLLFSSQSNAQVRGISYTLQPTVEYMFWSDQSGLDNNLLLGGKVGFGFGEYFELRGVYQQSVGLQTDFSDFDFDDNTIDFGSLEPRDAEYRRYGGEIKANIGRGKFLPYIVLGTGIQELRLSENDVRNEQIYLTGGLGVNFAIADRFTLLLAARNTGFRYATGRSLLTEADQTIFDLDPEDFDFEDIGTWSVSAGFNVYLGGRRPGTMSELDEAYFNSLRGGNGLGIDLEAMIGTINWNDASAYRDAPVWGGFAGLELGPYVGLRGFYWRAATEGDLFDFDDLQMFGGEMRLKIAEARGLTPYLLLGGGAIDVRSDYEGRSVTLDNGDVVVREADDSGFAMGGAGLMIPFSRNFKVFGSARALITSPSEDLLDVNEPNEVNTSWMYSAGFKINFGRRSERPEVLVQNRVDAAVAEQRRKDEAKMAELRAENEQQLYEVRQRYQSEVDSLDRELTRAYADNNIDRVDSLRIARQARQDIITRMQQDEDERVRAEATTDARLSRSADSDRRLQTTPAAYDRPDGPVYAGSYDGRVRSVAPRRSEGNGQIVMSVAEFQRLLEEVLEAVDPGYGYYPSYPPAPRPRVDASGNVFYPQPSAPDGQSFGEQSSGTDARAQEEQLRQMRQTLDELDRKFGDQNARINDLQQRLQRIETSLRTTPANPTPTPTSEPQPTPDENKQ